jgi:FdrA protein
VENKLSALLNEGPRTINIGVYEFAESLQAQGVETVHVNWSPPAGGDPELIDLLDQLL